ncbi:unnamed protein product [Rotaria magnacalcarata]
MNIPSNLKIYCNLFLQHIDNASSYFFTSKQSTEKKQLKSKNNQRQTMNNDDRQFIFHIIQRYFNNGQTLKIKTNDPNSFFF